MYEDSRSVPEPQVFGSEGRVTTVNRRTAESVRVPPRAADRERAARALLAQCMCVVRGELKCQGVPARDAPDLEQKVAISALPWWMERWREGECESEDVMRAYLRVSARRAAKRYFRRRSKQREVLECEQTRGEDAREECDERTPEELLLSVEANRRRWEMLSAERLSSLLGEKLWSIFRGWVVWSIPIRWLAEAENVPVPTIYTRIRQASRLLRAAHQRSLAAVRTR